MPAVSIKSIPGGLPEIRLPHSAAEMNYGKAMAEIMTSLATSSAAEARNQPSERFVWSLAYRQGDDPDTADPVEFAAMLSRTSEIYLLAKGFHWKGAATLDVCPPQIMAKFEERARLICGRQIDSNGQPDSEPDNPLVALNKWLAVRPQINKHLAGLARAGMAALLAAEDDR